MLGEAFLLHILESSLFRILRGGYFRLRTIKCALVHPSDDMRVAFSALLLVREGGEYLLVRNLHRPESFAPFGGVFKYTETVFLDKLEFKPQTFGSDNDMKNDLRGFLQRRKLAKLVTWFNKGTGREPAADCLTRELSEELNETGLLGTIKCPDVIPFRFVRSVQEGPSKVPGQVYTQYRIFEVYELDTHKSSIRSLEEELLRQARKGHKDLLMVTASEIVQGRDKSGQLIGHHAGYLFGHKRVRPESPMFNMNTAGK